MNGAYELATSGLVGTRLYLDEASVMGTENAIMAAVLAQGETVVGHAACEPHIQDLCRFLVALGARIEGVGSNVLRIDGVERLGGGSYRLGPDHIEVASFAALAAVSGGEVTVEDVQPDDLISIVPAFRKLGIQLEVGDVALRVPPGQELARRGRPRRADPEDRERHLARLPGRPHLDRRHGCDTGRGTVLIFEKMFESRLFFVDKLVSMGARIILCDPHRAVVTGPAKLYGERLESPDIRAGMAMVIAALCAEGTSTIGNIGQIDRGYERIDERLRGARRRDRARRAVSGARLTRGAGEANVATGVPVLDHLLVELARAGRFDLALEIDPDDPEAEVDAAGAAFGARVAPLLAPGAHGDAACAADEALAMVVVERSGHAARRLERRPQRRRRPRQRPRRPVPRGARRRGGVDAARAADRGRGHGSRARGDLQGARRRARRARTDASLADDDRRTPMEKHVIRTEDAPAPFQGAPYNQAIRVGELVFVAGQLGLKPGDTPSKATSQRRPSR